MTAGTILDKTRIPLTTWFEAAWHLTTAKNGVSAKTLERTLGTSYRTAWALPQRYRVAMVRSERERLSAAVEVDETLVGGVEVKEPKGFGRVPMRHVPDASGASLQPFAGDVIAQGVTVRTDGWTGYSGLLRHGYLHERTALSSSGDPAHVSMPGVHRVAALLKRWILGTHQGSVTPAHLQSYLEELTFRFNRRSSGSRGLVFRRLIEQAVVAGPLTEAELTFGYDWSRSEGGGANRLPPYLRYTEIRRRKEVMTHLLRYEVNCSILFTELPLLERPGAAKAAGFDAVEFWWPFATAVPSDSDVDAFVRSIEDAGVQLAGLNFFAGDMPGGDRGLVSWPARQAEMRDNIDVTVGVGERLNCRAFNALYGNRIDGVAADEQDELAVENLALVAKAAAGIDAVVLLEAVSGTPSYPLKLAADAIAVIDRVQQESAATNLALLLDLYHLAVNGDDLDAVIERHAARTAHVQVADSPGRGEPGSGQLDLDGYLTTLEAAGYTGWVGLEYKPTTTTTDSFAWLPRERRAATA